MSMVEIMIALVCSYGFVQKKLFENVGLALSSMISGLTLGKALKYYSSIVKGSKQKVRKFWELISVFENQGKN